MIHRRKMLFWSSLFAGLSVLSLDYWWWGRPARLGLFGLPTWVFYFVLLQFALAVAVYLFARHAWPDDDGES